MNNPFDYADPDAEIGWQVKDLGGGIVARYRRTLALKTREISGTGGYREGVDFHTEIHCAICCCKATEESGCRHPAGGFTIISGRAGCPSPWNIALPTLAAIHLQDPIRHVIPRQCTFDLCPHADGITTKGGNA